MGDPGVGGKAGARSAIWLVLEGLIGTLLLAGFSVLLARSMSTAAFGRFSAARGVLGLATIVATLGFGGLVINAVPRFVLQQEHARARGLLHLAPRVVMLSGVVFFGLILLLHATVERDPVVEVVQMAVLMAFLPAAALQSYLESAAGSLGGALRAATVTRIVVPGTAILLLGAFQPLLGDDVSVLNASGFWGGALLIGCIASWWVFRSRLPEFLRSGDRACDRREAIHSALPYLGSTAFLVWLDVGGLIVIGWGVDDAAAAGRFAAATQLSSFMVVIGVITLPLYLPRLAIAAQIGHLDKVREVQRRRAYVIVPLALVAGTLMCVFHRPLLGLFGDDYESAKWALVALVIGKGISTILALAVPQMQYIGETRKAVLILGSYAIGSVLVMGLLSRYGHANGVAVGQAVMLASASIHVRIAMVRLRKRKLIDDEADPTDSNSGGARTPSNA